MKLKSIAVSAIVAGLLIGCGGGSSSSDTTQTTDDSTQTGTFIDAPVAGIEYNTSSNINGITDENGSYKFKTGDKVTFKIANLELGTVEATQIITPVDLSDNNLTKASNIAYLIQSLDTDGDDKNNIIKLPSKDKLEDMNITTKDLENIEELTNKVLEIKTKLEEKYEENLPSLDVEEAYTNMKDYLQIHDIKDLTSLENEQNDDNKINNDINNSLIDTNNSNIVDNNITLSKETGFIKDAIIGKTFYIVHTYKGDTDLEKYGYVADMTFSFEDNKLDYDLEPTYVGVAHEDKASVSYSIDNGILNIDNNGGTYKITDVNGDIITTYHTSIQDPEANETRYFVPSKQEAENLAILLNLKNDKNNTSLLVGHTLYQIYDDSLGVFHYGGEAKIETASDLGEEIVEVNPIEGWFKTKVIEANGVDYNYWTLSQDRVDLLLKEFNK